MRPIVFLTVISLTLTGCSSTGLLKSPMTSLIRSDRKVSRVAKILCLWEPAEGQGLDEKPSRGFAGQVMFFGPGSPSPARVHGTVRIYQYADYDPYAEDPEPIHRFVFEDKAWNAHHVDATLGATYNVFLPYVIKGSRHAVCALRVEFESADGQIVSSPFTEVTLPGRSNTRPPTTIQPVQRNAVQPKTPTEDDRSRRQKELTTREVEQKLDTHTIRLPQRSGK